jgi:Na+/melibiose symporter-like transporter
MKIFKILTIVLATISIVMYFTDSKYLTFTSLLTALFGLYSGIVQHKNK